jgi:multicomponent Na+:H+ antiporter subunit E
LVYIPYLFKEIVKANVDVALRVIKPVIPLEPGIVAVKTKLKSKLGRMILANSITLTPGTLTVDIEGDTLHIHCIDLGGINSENASEKIASGFERYLEVIFG